MKRSDAERPEGRGSIGRATTLKRNKNTDYKDIDEDSDESSSSSSSSD